jgi:hypothetical protein
MENVIFPTVLYDPAEYMEYYSWYHTRTRPTLLSRPMPLDTRSYPEGPTNSCFGIVATLLHVQMCYSLPSVAIKLFTHFADSGGLRDAH